jgi:hypothetical protein
MLDSCTLKKGLRKPKHVANRHRPQPCLSDVTWLYFAQYSELGKHPAAIIYPEHYGRMGLRNAGKHLPDSTVSPSRTPQHTLSEHKTKYSCLIEPSGSFVTVIWCGVDTAGSLYKGFVSNVQYCTVLYRGCGVNYCAMLCSGCGVIYCAVDVV